MQCRICGYENSEDGKYCTNCGARLFSSGGATIDDDQPSIGPFSIIGEIGHGAMGRVWRAWDNRLQREVAIKEPIFNPGLDPSQRERLTRRFLVEGRAAARLSHPNIVTIHSADAYSGVPIIVMELVDGTTLSSLLSTWGRLDQEFALSLLNQLLDAVGYAHAQGVIHRDIKPENIFVTNDRILKLGDFGIAHLDSTTDTTLTMAGVVLGAPGYMSPEQVMGMPVDARSDIFSIGVVAYEMFTGRNPFVTSNGANTLALLYRIANEPADPSANELLFQYAPAHVARAILAALEKEPERRPQSAAEFKALLSWNPASTVKQANTIVDEPPQHDSSSGDLIGDNTPILLPEEGPSTPQETKGRAWLPYAVATSLCLLFLGIVLASQAATIVPPMSSGPDVPESAMASMVYDGHTYAIFDINSDWQGARDFCDILGGHLVTVTSEEEQLLLEELLDSGTRNTYWIGGSLVAPQTWEWVTGEAFEYTNWAENAPDNFIVPSDDGNANGADPNDIAQSENALAVYRVENPKAPHKPGTWNDLASNGDCKGEEFFGLENIGFICEWDYA